MSSVLDATPSDVFRFGALLRPPGEHGAIYGFLGGV